ncbi:hypothetical protein RHECNPAF_750056 [Rhizobium etli CNPAF512]|nr:hypothetical protein RHECNPAF_750056 [Rhizobium etli CNPAF512]
MSYVYVRILVSKRLKMLHQN